MGGGGGTWLVESDWGQEGCSSPLGLGQMQAEAEQAWGLLVPGNLYLPEAFSADCGIQFRTFNSTCLF